MHSARLATHLSELGMVLNRQDPVIHVALTARRKFYSRLITSLEKAQRRDPERHNEHRSQSPSDASSEQQNGKPDSGR